MSQTLRDDEVEVAVDVALLSGAPQGGRSPTGGAPDSSAAPSARASTEVVPPTARRRQFSPAYKRRMVRVAEACKDQPGAMTPIGVESYSHSIVAGGFPEMS